MSRVTVIRQQMLQTLIAALATSDGALAPGGSVKGGPAVAPTPDPKALAGQVLEGQISQIRPDGQAVLQTKSGPVALILPEALRPAPATTPQTAAGQPLTSGQMVRLEVASTLVDGQLSGRIISQAAQSPITQSANAPLQRTLATASQPPQPTSLSAATAKAAAAPLAASALLRQAGLAPLFANLAAVVSSPVAQAQLPRPLVAAIQAALAARLPLDHAGEPQRLREAVRQSGLFHEAFTAAGVTSATPDLKAQLQGLKALLAQATPAVPEGLAGELPMPDARPATLAGNRAPIDAARTPPAQILAPPRANGSLEAQGAMLPTVDPESSAPAQLVRTLAAQVDGALDRQTLLQVASLPQTTIEARQEGGQIQRWFVELPVTDRGQTHVLPLEIEEDRRNASTDEPEQRIWRVKFALDDASLGPVHAAVTLVNRRIAVTFWAEREVTRAALRAGRDLLSSTLTATRFADAEIEVLAGAPPKPKPDIAGGFLDQRA